MISEKEHRKLYCQRIACTSTRDTHHHHQHHQYAYYHHCAYMYDAELYTLLQLNINLHQRIFSTRPAESTPALCTAKKKEKKADWTGLLYWKDSAGH